MKFSTFNIKPQLIDILAKLGYVNPTKVQEVVIPKALKNENIIVKSETTNYGKIATAIGKIRQEGVDITPPDINRSTYTFSPDVETNTIRYGLSGITRIGEDLVKQIIANRPYSDLSDFLSKNKLTKPQVVNLIKSGAFDSICEDRYR